MCTLTEDEKNIIMSRYYEDLTQCEVARKLSMSQVMVSRYEKKGIEKMRNYLSLQYKYHHLLNNNSGDFILNKEEYKKLVDQATEILAKAYQVAGQWCAHELDEVEL